MQFKECFVWAVVFLWVFTSCASAPGITDYKYNPDKLGFENDDERMLRDALDRKIQDNEEAELIFDARELSSREATLGRKILSIGGGIYLFPVLVVVGLVFIPLAILATPYWIGEHMAQKEEIRMYVLGRDYFARGDMRQALMYFMALLYRDEDYALESDVLYWIGRCYEAMDHPQKAKEYYHLFIVYSQSTSPEHFEGKVQTSPPIGDLLKEAQSRLEKF